MIIGAEDVKTVQEWLKVIKTQTNAVKQQKGLTTESKRHRKLASDEGKREKRESRNEKSDILKDRTALTISNERQKAKIQDEKKKEKDGQLSPRERKE